MITNCRVRRCVDLAALVLALGFWASASAQAPMHRFTGTGDDVSDMFDVPGSIAIPCRGACGLYLLVMQHSGDGNFIVSLLSADGNREALAANKIGNYSGARLLPIQPGMYRLQIRASGGWQPALVAVDDIEASDLPYTFGRTGDSAMGAVRLKAGLLRATLAHAGDENFIVQLYHANGTRVGILVNEIGDYKGVVAERIPAAGVYYLDIQADGEWSIALTQ